MSDFPCLHGIECCPYNAACPTSMYGSHGSCQDYHNCDKYIKFSNIVEQAQISPSTEEFYCLRADDDQIPPTPRDLEDIMEEYQ